MRRMFVKKVYYILFVSYAFFTLGFPISWFNENISISQVFIKSIIHAFSIGFVFLILCNLVIFISWLTQSLYYFSKGYGLAPVLCYPVLFTPSQKRKIRLLMNFLYIEDYIYPEKLFKETKEIYDDKKVSTLCKTAHLYGFISQILFCIIGILLSLWKTQLFIGIGIGLMAGAYTMLALHASYSHHGLLVRRNFMKQGHTVFYLTKQAVLYNNDNNSIYKVFEDKIQNEIEHMFLLWSMETVKHMHMIGCINYQFEFQFNKQDIIRHNFLLKTLDEYYSVEIDDRKFHSMEIADEKLNFMKVYMCYGMIRKDEEALDLVLSYFDILSREEKQRSLFATKYLFSWYSRIGRRYEIEQQKSKLYKSKLLRLHSFYYKFDNYRNNYDEVTKCITDLCKEVVE